MSAGNPVVSIALGFIVLTLVLVELYGFSASNAILAIPVVVLGGLFMLISHLLATLSAFFLGALFAGPLGLLVLVLALALVSRSAVGLTAQNYLVLAVFVILALLIA